MFGNHIVGFLTRRLWLMDDIVTKDRELCLRLSLTQLYVIGLSHLPRFDHDCNRGHHREGIGIIVTDLIRSYRILMSIVAIGLIVIKFLTAKKFSTIIPIDELIVFIASDRNTSYQIATDRIINLLVHLNRGYRNKSWTRKALRCDTISYDMLRFVAMH